MGLIENAVEKKLKGVEDLIIEATRKRMDENQKIMIEATKKHEKLIQDTINLHFENIKLQINELKDRVSVLEKRV